MDPGQILQLKLSFYQDVLDQMGQWIDIVCEMDDFGHQQRLWVSVEMFRKLIKPRYAQLFSFIKKRHGKKILFHSDGAIYPLIPDIIEMGVEILNPIQVGAKDMGDTRKLKKGIRRLPHLLGWRSGYSAFPSFFNPSRGGRPSKTAHRGPSPGGGGYVFAATQAIRPETPPKNIMAMWKALQSYGIYRGNPD